MLFHKNFVTKDYAFYEKESRRNKEVTHFKAKIPMKLLFISRAYPPVVGGIENHNYELAQRFVKSADTTLLINTRGKKFLPFFLPYALIKTVVTAKRYDAILFGDGVLSVIGFFVVLLTKKPVVASVIHGLDITYKNSLYQILWVRMFLPSLTTLIAVSQETKNIAIQHNLPERKIKVIPNGVAIPYQPHRYTREDLSKLLGVATEDKVVLLTHGRLAKRKGVEWFIHNVLVTLPSNIHYVISGDGPEKAAIKSAVVLHGLESRVTLLGRIDEVTKLTLLHTIDIFIQPNITVPGDMEGFGIAVIEATACARLVIASDIEGLTDAIAEGKNGIPLPSGDTHAWTDTVLHLARNKEERLTLGQEFQKYTLQHFSWDTIVQEYLSTLASRC